MKLLPLRARGKVVVAHAMVDDRHFDELSKFSWHMGNKGHPKRSQAARPHPPITVYLHWHVWQLEFGERPVGEVEIDHIDRDPLNNQAANLRAVPVSLQNANRNLQANNSTGSRNVFWEPDPRYRLGGFWRVTIRRDERTRFRKTFRGDEAGRAEAARVAEEQFRLIYPELVP